MRWLAATALCACSRTVETSARVDSRATATLEALHLEQHDAERIRDTTEVTHIAATVTVETWQEPAPDGGAPLTHRRVTRAGPVDRERKAETRSAEHGSASTATQAVTTVDTHAESATRERSSVAFGFQLWLVLVPVALIALVLVARPILRRFIPWIP